MIDAEAQRRFLQDPIFHARVEQARKILQQEPRSFPVEAIAEVLHAHDRAQLASPDDPLFGDPELHRSLLDLASQPGMLGAQMRVDKP